MKKNIALITGGDSGENVISLKSAKIIKEYIDKEIYNVFTILLSGSKWIYIADDNQEITVNKNDFTIIVKNEKINFDCAFIAIHGTPGEDGKLQGYLDIIGIPYTFSNHVTSALTFNKSFCRSLAKEYGAVTAKSILIRKDEAYDIEKIISKTSLPCFVKPNNGGSSIGMSKIKNKEDLQAAIKIAFCEDTEVSIEEFIEGVEVTCGIFQKKDDLIALPLTEIVPKHEYFDFEAKYDEKLCDEIIPARVPDEMHQKCKEISMHLFKKFNCKGISRFDYIIKNNTPYFLEVNTIPGLSDASIVPRQAASVGISLKELFTILIKNVIE